MGLGEQLLLSASGFNGETGTRRSEDTRGPAPGRLGKLTHAVKQGIVEIEDDAFNFFCHLK